MSESNIQASPGSIFICYRREDSADVTGRIYDRLVDHFGPERVFMDVEAIRLGYDFRSEIDQTIKVCSIVIVVIGDEWLAQVDGKRRIDDENDRVRIEIESALRREIPIIPVLTRGTSHPTKAMLPASLEALAYRHGTSIRHEHFRGDVDSLISQMDKLLARQESTPSKPAEAKEPTPPVKSTQTTQSQPAIPPVASISAIAASKEPAVWRRKRLIIVSAVGATAILLLAITWSLTRPHPSVGPSEPSKPAEPKLTDQGDAAAQFNLGVKYNYGRGVPKDLEKAAAFYQKAADQGHADAQNNLAALYENGQGVPKDWSKAAELCKKAADQGNAAAQNHLGWLYRNGQGVPKDLGKAVELYQQAADHGNVRAQYNLGLLYEDGQGVPKDLGKAAELYQKAANQGYRPAIENLKTLSGQTPTPAATAKPQPKMSDMEWDTDRFGADYTGFFLPRDSPKQCEDACRSDEKCRSWTYVKPNTIRGPKPMCYLKSAIPPRQDNPYCVSGTKVAPAEPAATVTARLAAIPDFSGTWEMISSVYNGKANPVNTTPLVITQNGSMVRIGNRDLQISDTGTVGYQTYAAHDNAHGHEVPSAAQADLIDTLTWRIEGSILVIETTFEYKHTYGKHSPGTDFRVMRYRLIGK
jgi:hypothetical protein